MLCQFRCIVRARSKREIKNALNDLRNCDYWKRGDENFVNWSENPWIPLITVYQTDIHAAYTKGIVCISHINFYIIYKFVYTLFYLYKRRFI